MAPEMKALTMSESKFGITAKDLICESAYGNIR
jgi:hypothetical protein